MNLSMFSLEGKIALVTGGSRGIGRASALHGSPAHLGKKIESVPAR